MEARARGPSAHAPGPSALEVEQYVAECGELLEAASERINYGQLHESLQYQLQLQQNLIYLATHADEHPDLTPLQITQPPAAGAKRRAADDDGPAEEEDAGPAEDGLLERLLQARPAAR